MKHIYLDKFFLFFLLVIIITGSFNSFFPFFSLLFLHELGHAITGIIKGYKLDKITFYPYGGVTSFNMPLNTPLKDELLILIMGPITQVIAYLILKNYFNDLELYHYTLLIFNLLPIYPLDGGKILNIFCSYFCNYLVSIKISFYFSFLILIILFIYNIHNFNLNMILMIIILFTKLISYYKKRSFYYNRFLLERHLYDYKFSKIKNIQSISDFFRDKKHYVNFKDEKEVLKEYFGKIVNKTQK